ncbi:MAG TPA: bifunctional indole-3-glycerol phosphate synthase/phosphoribosylanthranilate isomerase [Spirochaetia bacterium]|nr:bifunctional indole-3-glycerol phosphate synthase/phosphoribosylanthranilate isomerase [Spirochaetia bacterium]
MNVLNEIAETRRQRILREGATLGVPLPELRASPLVPFGRDPFVICEIKRRSPSRGEIVRDLDPVAQAARYVAAGIRSISVLTEADHFGGSLADLLAVKKAFPQAALLRKDFLLSEEDIELSHRAGADAVLLIAALLDPGLLATMHRRATELGMAALVEVHTVQEIDKVRDCRPELVGVNSRDLATFHVDRLLPVRLRPLIDWPCRTVFESGIYAREDSALAVNAGYSGVLVGEAVMRAPARIPDIVAGIRDPGADGRFWARLFGRSAHAARTRLTRPLVKICGLTNAEDVGFADSLGADLLGFIFAESPRRVDPALLRRLPPTRAQRVAVVVLNVRADDMDTNVTSLLSEGLIDAVQLHGDETPDAVRALGFPRYKALRPTAPGELDQVSEYGTLRVLVDAYSGKAYGGTGKQIAPEIALAARKQGPLWIAGGIGADNVAQVVEDYEPELIDASSRLESVPGRKDHALLRRFFREVSITAGGMGEST